jgi:sugar lactone lactonase YvrE
MKGKGSNACGTGGIPCAVCTGSETCKFYLCLGCLSDADCGGETPICDYATGSCVACLSGADCPDCKICLEHACVTVEWSNVTTFGSGPGSTSNQFNAPNGLALSSDDLEVYVSDALNFRIAVWSRPDTTSTSWTPLTTFGSSSDFGLPDGVAISSDKLTAFVPGNVGYVTAWSRPGTTGSDATAWSLQTTIGTASIDNPAADQFNSPRNVFVSPDMLTIYVPDNGLQRISVWSRPGITGSDATAWTHQYNFGDTGTDPSDLIGPEDIILSADGLTAWIGESRGRVSIWTRPDTTTDPSAWTYQMAFGQEESGPGQFEGLGQIAVSPDELTIWITDNTRVSVWSRPDATSSEWTAGTPIGREGSLPCELDLPAGVEVAADGVTIFIADHNNNRISVWKKD